jgi:hypothetical protein
MSRTGRGHKLLAAGTATLIAEPVLALAHQGGLGILVGLAAGAAAYALSDDIGHLASRHNVTLPARPPKPTREGKRDGLPSLAHRLLVGKSVREAEAAARSGSGEPTTEDLEDTRFVDLEALLDLGELRPHADTIFSNRLAILGMSGAGKSNTVAALIEELGQYDAPLIVFDHKPEYGPLCQQPYLTRPVRASAQNVTPQNAVAVAHQIMAERLQVVVDLASYKSDVEAALVMVSLIEGVERWQRGLPNESRIPCTFVLDEAHYWLPENEAHSTLRGHRDAAPSVSLAYVQQVFFNLAKVGRSLGEGLVIATQRPADVDKRLISQAEWRFLLKALEPADLKVYRSYGLADEIAQSLNPKRGDAYVIGPDGVRGIYHLRQRRSPDVARSPGLANIRAAAATSPRSPVHGSPGPGSFERGNASTFVPQGNAGTGVNGLPEPVNSYTLYREPSPASANTVNGPEEEAEPAGYTMEEEIMVVKAYAELVRTGAPVTRRGIRDYLEWNNRQFSRVIKPVCDKHGIAMREQ